MKSFQDIEGIDRIRLCDDDDDCLVNRRLREGWKLIGVFQRATQSDGELVQYPVAVLGKLGPEQEAGEIVDVMSIHADDASRFLGKDGWRLLATYIKGRGDGGDEWAVCLLGRPKTGAKSTN